MSTPAYRYPGTHSFTTAEQLQFFGREREAKELFRLVALNPVVVLFGKSGTGKTSLLQAGLSPLLQELQLQPVRLRLNDTAHSISRQLWEQFNEGEYLPLGTPDNLSLLEYCRRFDHTVRGTTMSPLLLLDQFEELFTLYGDQPEERDAFIAQLAALLGDSRQRASAGQDSVPVRVIISIRSDFLYLLDRLSTHMPAILRCRYELSPLDEANARRAITAPAALEGDFASRPFTYSEAALNTILDNLRAQREAGDKSREVEAFLLQQFCQRIERLLLEKGAPAGFEVEESFFGGKEGIDAIRDSFYAEVLAKCAPEARRAVQQLVEEKLISAERRIIAERETIKRAPGLTDEVLRLLCNERLLREEPRGGSFYYEISHDTLLETVLKAKEKRLAVEAAERQAAERQAAEERAREAEEKAMEERRRAEEAERLRMLAEQNEARAGQRTRLAVLVSLLAVVLAVVAGVFYVRAAEDRQRAEAAKDSAEVAKTAAEGAKNEAEANLQEAERQRQKAIAATQEAEKNYAAAQANLRRAEQEEKRAKAALVQVEREKAATEAQRRIAEDNYAQAQEATKKAGDAEKSAKRTLDDLIISNQKFARLTFYRDTERDIQELNYDYAYERVKSDTELGILKDTIASTALELAFWYGETGQKVKADTMLTIAYKMLNKQPDLSISLRQSIESANKNIFHMLMKKYYPLDTAFVSGGTFEMGCKGRRDGRCYDGIGNRTLHDQTIDGFTITRHEITWWQYRLFCEATQREYEAPGWGVQGNNPAVNVSWYDAVEYANWVSQRMGLDTVYSDDGSGVIWDLTKRRNGYRLPTEAEWEYAARGGQEQAYAGCSSSEALGEYAWYSDNNKGRTQPVKSKKPNAYGLYDMSGNVWEWCWDWYGDYPEVDKKDYSGPEAGSYRVVRGGSWGSDPQSCRVADRRDSDPGLRGRALGFRLARTP